MCFSYSVNLNAQTLQSKLNLGEVVVPSPGYFFSGFNHPLLPVIVSERSNSGNFGAGTPVAKSMQWGLIPSWVREAKKADELREYGLNARAESLEEKPMFRDAWKSQPCVIPASGFFEWKTIGKKKEPYYIYPREGEFMLFAGLFSRWIHPETGEEVNTYSIITTEANSLMAEIHNTKQRMPVILAREEFENYLSGSILERTAMLRPCSEDDLAAHRVSPLASNARANRNVVSVLKPFSEDYSQTLF